MNIVLWLLDVFNVANSFYWSEQFSIVVLLACPVGLLGGAKERVEIDLDSRFSWEILIFVASSCKMSKTLGNRKNRLSFLRNLFSVSEFRIEEKNTFSQTVIWSWVMYVLDGLYVLVENFYSFETISMRSKNIKIDLHIFQSFFFCFILKLVVR